MNPAVVVIIALAATASWMGRRREWRLFGIATFATSLVLLTPALRIAGGVPSAAANLANHVPWTVSTGASNPALDDVAFTFEPWLVHLRREVRAGRLPFWNPYQDAGTPFWGNPPTAPLFPLTWIAIALPLRLGLVLVPWLKLLIAAFGMWALGRQLGLSRTGSWLAASVFPLSGMFVAFLLSVMTNAIALTPWILWATERLTTRQARWVTLSALVAVQLLAGHPETAIHTALIAAIYLGVRGASARTWIAFAGAWIAAPILAAVQLLPAALTVLQSRRWLIPADLVTPEPPLGRLLVQPLRIVLPYIYGDPGQHTWWGPFNFVATSAFVSVTALVLAATALGRSRGDRRWLAIVVILAFSILTAYHLPGPYWLLSRLPVLDHVAHHRLIFAVELTLALLAGAGLDRWRSTDSSRAILIAAVLVMATAVVTLLVFRGDWIAHVMLGARLRDVLQVSGIAAGLAIATVALRPAMRARAAPLLVTVALIELLVANSRIVPAVAIDRFAPATGAIQFLQTQPDRVVGAGTALRPNTATLFELRDVRSDDPLRSSSYQRFFQALSAGNAEQSAPVVNWTDPALDQLAMRWVVMGAGDPPPVANAGWRVAYDGPDARIYERPSARAIVRWERGDSAIQIVNTHPGHWELRWTTARAGDRLIVAEAANSGWHATLNGVRTAIETADGVLMAIPVADANGGTVTLDYMPTGFVAGALLSAFSMVLFALAMWRFRRT